MSRGIWFVAGAGAGVYAMVRGRRMAEALTAEGLRDRWHGLEAGARLFRDEVAQGYAEKETELRQRYGLVPDGRPQLAAGRHRAAPDPLGAPVAAGQHPEGPGQHPDLSTTDIQEGSH
ncbi:DUF6167 family protein [Nocardioides panaciterrulae]|uniref:Uncharacterized protein n=1 Tax=Nocardioides panaciterrulae TaxID=661492 RepID=A0A7Y9E6E8_9ACTN|nr:DUF6167 family protein [Nocardioides panaciterrulae]NYD42086.1 hypothetical protein [Nocardioides panaciterrulae]